MADNDPNKRANDAKKSLKDIQDITKAIEDGFRSMSDALGDVVEEIKDGSQELNSFNDITNDISKSIRKLTKANEDLINNQIKLNSGALDSKRVQEQINRITSARQVLQSRLASLQEEINKKGGATVEQQEKLNTLTAGLASVSEEVESQFTKQLNKAKQVEQTTGNTGKWLKAMTKIPIVGQFIDADKALQAMQQRIAQGGNALQGLGAALKVVGNSIISNLANPLTLITTGISFLTEVDKSVGDLAKGTNISYNSALKLKKEFAEVEKNTGNIFLNSANLSKSLVAINQSLGTSARVSQEELNTFTELREKAGYTNEELAALYRVTLATGGTLKNNVKSFAGTVQYLNTANKLAINEKQLLKEVSQVSDAIKLSVGGTAQKIAEAAFKAKQFGINLEQADRMAQGLLNFEESITAELEAELLTGKDLNLERARLLALNNDIAGAAEEVLKQVKSSAEFSKMNRLQQESIAKAVGLSREELAKSLVEREALVKLGVQDLAGAQARYEEIRKTKSMEEAIKELGDDAFARQIAQTSNAEKYTALVEKLKDQFIPIAEQILPKISDLIEWIGKNMGTIQTMFKGIGTIIAVNWIVGFAQSIQSIGSLLRLMGSLIKRAAVYAATWAIANPVAAVAGLTAAAMVGTVIYRYMADDMVSTPQGYGNRTLLTSKGAIALNNEDTLIAGTNLFPSKKGDDVVSSPKGSVNIGGGMNTSQMEAKLDKIADILSNIATTEGKAIIDVDKLVTIMSMKTSYKVQ